MKKVAPPKRKAVGVSARAATFPCVLRLETLSNFSVTNDISLPTGAFDPSSDWHTTHQQLVFVRYAATIAESDKETVFYTTS